MTKNINNHLISTGDLMISKRNADERREKLEMNENCFVERKRLPSSQSVSQSSELIVLPTNVVSSHNSLQSKASHSFNYPQNFKDKPHRNYTISVSSINVTDNQENDLLMLKEKCFRCGKVTRNFEQIIKCTRLNCAKVFHKRCLVLPYTTKEMDAVWLCDECNRGVDVLNLRNTRFDSDYLKIIQNEKILSNTNSGSGNGSQFIDGRTHVCRNQTSKSFHSLPSQLTNQHVLPISIHEKTSTAETNDAQIKVKLNIRQLTSSDSFAQQQNYDNKQAAKHTYEFILSDNEYSEESSRTIKAKQNLNKNNALFKSRLNKTDSVFYSDGEEPSTKLTEYNVKLVDHEDENWLLKTAVTAATSNIIFNNSNASTSSSILQNKIRTESISSTKEQDKVSAVNKEAFYLDTSVNDEANVMQKKSFASDTAYLKINSRTKSQSIEEMESKKAKIYAKNENTQVENYVEKLEHDFVCALAKYIDESSNKSEKKVLLSTEKIISSKDTVVIEKNKIVEMEKKIYEQEDRLETQQKKIDQLIEMIDSIRAHHQIVVNSEKKNPKKDQNDQTDELLSKNLEQVPYEFKQPDNKSSKVDLDELKNDNSSLIADFLVGLSKEKVKLEQVVYQDESSNATLTSNLIDEEPFSKNTAKDKENVIVNPYLPINSSKDLNNFNESISLNADSNVSTKVMNDTRHIDSLIQSVLVKNKPENHIESSEISSEEITDYQIASEELKNYNTYSIADLLMASAFDESKLNKIKSVPEDKHAQEGAETINSNERGEEKVEDVNTEANSLFANIQADIRYQNTKIISKEESVKSMRKDEKLVIDHSSPKKFLNDDLYIESKARKTIEKYEQEMETNFKPTKKSLKNSNIYVDTALSSVINRNRKQMSRDASINHDEITIEDNRIKTTKKLNESSQETNAYVKQLINNAFNKDTDDDVFNKSNLESDYSFNSVPIKDSNLSKSDLNLRAPEVLLKNSNSLKINNDTAANTLANTIKSNSSRAQSALALSGTKKDTLYISALSFKAASYQGFLIRKRFDKLFKPSEKVYCVLDGIYFYIYKKQTDKKQQRMLNLIGCVIRNYEENIEMHRRPNSRKKPHLLNNKSFEIELPFNSKVYQFMAANVDQCEKWLNLLRITSNENYDYKSELRQTFNQPISQIESMKTEQAQMTTNDKSYISNDTPAQSNLVLDKNVITNVGKF